MYYLFIELFIYFCRLHFLNSLWILLKALLNIFSSLEKPICKSIPVLSMHNGMFFSIQLIFFLTRSWPASWSTSSLKAFVTYLHFQAVRRKWKMSQQSVLQPDIVIVRGGGDWELCPGTVDEHSLLIWPQGRGGPPIKIWFQAQSILGLTTAEWQPWAPSLSQRVKPGSADSSGKYESMGDGTV